MEPADCAPVRLSEEDPGQLLRIDWEDDLAVYELTVDTELDMPMLLIEGDYHQNLNVALEDGSLSLREAVAVSALADRPVRIDFSTEVFPLDGSAPTIEVVENIRITGKQVLLDGRDASVTLRWGNQLSNNMLSIEGSQVALVNLKFRDVPLNAGLWICNTRGVYLSSLVFEDNNFGVYIEDSGSIVFSDGGELRNVGFIGRTQMIRNREAIRIINSPKVVVAGVDFLDSGNSGILFSNSSSDLVTIGPPTGWRQAGTGFNVFSGGQFGINIDGQQNVADLDVKVEVRGNVFEDNLIDMRVYHASGEINFVHNTAIDTIDAVIDFQSDSSSGILTLNVLNCIQYSLLPIEHLRCHGSSEWLVPKVDYIMISNPMSIDGCPGFREPEIFWLESAPGFTSVERGDFTLSEQSPAVDKGLVIELEATEIREAQTLDVNFDLPDDYCGEAPDLGVFEMCR